MILKASYRTMEIKSRSGRIGAQFFHVSSLFKCLPTSVITTFFYLQSKLPGHDVSHLGRDLPPMDGHSHSVYKDLRCDGDARRNERKERGEKKEARHQGPRDWQMSRVTSGGR
jgi:hypothetical protein